MGRALLAEYLPGLKNVNNSIGSLFGFENEDGEPISFTEGVSQKWEDIRKGFSEGMG